MGGAAGGGKTRGLLLEPIRHQDNPDFGAVIFRRSFPQIKRTGGMWSESWKLYPKLGAEPNVTDLSWVFPSGATIKFAHLQHEKDVGLWDGAQVPLFGFDQLEEFTEHQFWYLFSRNRSTCGVAPYIRATCNPVPADDETGGWLRTLLAWWIDEKSGLPIAERAGVVRWFVREGDTLVWGDSAKDLMDAHPEREPKSLTFIPAKLSDNPVLLAKNPEYQANLKALPLVERERLLGGNWNVRPTGGKVFNRAWFEIVDAAPADLECVRYWDKAATPGAGAMSAGMKMGRSKKTARGMFYLTDAKYGHWSARDREKVILQTAEEDGRGVPVIVEQEPGSGGKESAESTIRMLAGWNVRADRPTGDKVERAMPMSAQVEAGNVILVRGEWNAEFLNQAHRFDRSSKLKDMVDAAVGGFNWLNRQAAAVPAISFAGANKGFERVSPWVIE